MSNTPVLADNSIPPEGRRAKVRQPLGSLAYLDIAPGNGGIILNLSEDGLALQAVAPLHGLDEVQLVIQLPHSDAHLETAAQIVWLGASSRQAGVRFLSMPPEARAQIREWIESQVLPEPDHAPEAAPVPEPVQELNGQSSSASDPDTSADSRREKWLSLMTEFEEDMRRHQVAGGEPPEGSPEAASELVPPPTVVPVLRPRPEIVPKRPIAQATRDFASRALGESSRELLDYASVSASFPAGIPAAEPNLRNSPSAPFEISPAPNEKTADQTKRSASTGICSPKDLPSDVPQVGSDFTVFRVAVRERESEASGVNSHTEIPAPPGNRALNQVALIALFALFSMLCFGIGAWVGRLQDGSVGGNSAANLSGPYLAPETAAPQRAAAVASDRPARHPAHTRRIIRERARPQSSAPAPTETAQSIATTAVPAVGSGEQSSLSAAVERNPLPASSATSRPALLPGDQRVDASADTDTAPKPSPPVLPAEASAPQVVNGYRLRPSDRFNPCHLTYRVDPIYPPEAQQQGIEGTVNIHLAIAADGSVESEKLVSGPPQLVSAALEAAKYWRYLPALLNGQPIPDQTDIAIVFRLPR
jgi:TonB family protein